jgi:hypothetical protein
MCKKLRAAAASSVASDKVPAPVRVKLKRVNRCNTGSRNDPDSKRPREVVWAAPGPSVPVRALRVGWDRRQVGYQLRAGWATKSPAEAGPSRDVRHLSSGRLAASAGL